MYTLTKEEFWSDMQTSYPEAMELFSMWIDQYKQEVNWNKLFGENVKFHDLPFEMQNGVIARFDIEACFSKEEYKDNMPMYRRQFENLFADVQRYKSTIRVHRN